ncbi:MAG: amidohydrolase family protein [Planctomycetota bacterium]
MAKELHLVGGTAVLPNRILKPCHVVCRDERIVSLGAMTDSPPTGQASSQDGLERETIDLAGRYLVPGFIDLHVHGGAGADFMDGTIDAVVQSCDAHLRHGTTSIFPTTTTGDSSQIHAMLDSVTASRGRTKARIPGVHLYGPFFAANKVGCHDVGGRRDPLAKEYQAYFDSGEIRIATCAAELPGAMDFYDHAREYASLLTCGHSNASFAEMTTAFENGMRHVDHFWCAMSSVASLRQRFGAPMQASMAEFVLMNRKMSTEVIADGCHLSPELLEFAYCMIGPERLCLVTDCNRALDMPAGEYAFGQEMGEARFYSDGQVGWALDRSSLASSVKGMDHMVRTMKSVTTADLVDVIKMATLTPAKRTHIDEQVGSIEEGKLADFVVLDTDLNVVKVIVGGSVVSDEAMDAVGK